MPEHFQYPTAMHDLTTEMVDLFVRHAEGSSSSSSSASPASAPASFDKVHDFAVFNAKAYDGDASAQVTPVPHVVSASDEQFMSQFLTPDFMGYM